jgi:ribosome-binding factor A
VAPDLSNAVVHYSAMGAESPEDIERLDDGLASAAAFLRRRAAHALPFKRMPELRFRYDPSLSLGSEMLGLLREIADEERSDAPESGGSEAQDDEAK